MSTFLKSLPGQWQDKVIFAIGAFVFVSPWLLLYADSPAPAWNAWVIGVVFMAGALVAVAFEPYWPEFVVAFMAFWHVLAPRILGYTDETLATGAAVAAGAVVAYLALWSSIARSRLLRERGTTPLDATAAGRTGAGEPTASRGRQAA